MERKVWRISVHHFWVLYIFGALTFGFTNYATHRWPRTAPVLSPFGSIALLLSLVGLAVGFAYGVRLLPGRRAQCPRCNRRSLRALARAHHRYECVECKARLKRPGFQRAWEDASGPEDDKFYRPRSNAGRWTAYEPPRLDKSPLGKLLRNKWLRNRSGPIKPVAMAPPASSHDSLHDPWLDG